MDDREILSKISELVQQEHLARDHGDRADEQQIQRALDQCWDLLRQRRARAEFGEDPSVAQARPETEVEGYQQ